MASPNVGDRRPPITPTGLVSGGSNPGRGDGHFLQKPITKIFKLRALRAPMYDARTGKKYRELRLGPGRVYTFGRSRNCCDVVFSDGRVSRQHCQVYWENVTNELLLFEGAPVDIGPPTGKVTRSSAMLGPQSKIKPSLNGLYVDGRKVAQGGCRILNPGAEVSLVACTKAAQTVEDPGFGDAVGFFVEVVELSQVKLVCPVYPRRPAQSDIKMVGSQQLGHFEKDCVQLPSYSRKRRLSSSKQGPWRATDEKSSISIELRSSSSSITTVKKKPKRSTAEIMGLLRRQQQQQQQQQQASSGLTKIYDEGLGEKVLKDQRLNRLHENSRVVEQNFDNLEISRECGTKAVSTIDFTKQDTEMLLESSSRSRVIDGGVITPAPATISLTKATDVDDGSTGPEAEFATKPDAGCLMLVAGNTCRSAADVMERTCPSGGVQEGRCTPDDLVRNVQGLAQGNMSNADGVLNGNDSGSEFRLNRLKDTETDSQIPSQQTVSLQELLNPTDGLLGIFVATFTSDILWFLSSHNISPELPVTVACHDRDRCWSTAEEARTSSPYPSWPNVTVVYPVFPDSCCFSTRKRQGIGCHHPKIFLLPRKDRIRVVVSSANLTRSQWLHVTNSVWSQDFPRKDLRDYKELFCTSGADENGLISEDTPSDFAKNLSSFIASLVADVPSAAHWALDLAEFDFSNAAASLVTSVPGLYGCPCPPLPASVRDVDLLPAEDGVQRTRKLLAAVNSSVVGVHHRFKDSADPCGKRFRSLSAILRNSDLHEDGMFKVRLERITNLAADSNAVSVIVSLDAIQGGMEMITGKDFLEAAGDSFSFSIPANTVHIGFLPRSVAKWVAPLYDNGLCTFAGFINPNEVFGVASGLIKTVAQLVLYVFEGRTFSSFSSRDLSLHHKVALCGLLRSMERPLGLWRLHQILSKFNWPDSAETDFIYGSSSIGTSLDASFLAAFSVAAGKKAIPTCNLSEESDSQWGAWTVEHEANAPSIGVVFPTIERVKAARGGPFTHQAVLCFAESTWERLKPACLLYDAVPFPADREGIAMHVKVAQRRFLSHPGQAPYGWVYCGSHNFSPAAWGRPHAKAVHPCSCRKTTLGCTLSIWNYEVGIVFVEPPPPDEGQRNLQFKPLLRNHNLEESKMESDVGNKRLGLDKFVLPFRVPPPKYEDVDQPATKRAMYNVAEMLRNALTRPESGGSDDNDAEMTSSEADDEGDDSQLCLEFSANSQREEEYGGLLWSQVDPLTTH